jgi:hypothetical protein
MCIYLYTYTYVNIYILGGSTCESLRKSRCPMFRNTGSYCIGELCPYYFRYTFFVSITYVLLDEFIYYVGHVEKSGLCETLFHCILSKHHHHMYSELCPYYLRFVISVPFYYLCGYFSLLMPYWL